MIRRSTSMTEVIKNLRAHRSRLRKRLFLRSMNNSQFRRLLDTSATPPQSQKNGNPAPTPRREGLLASSLGSRMRSSIPMTPYTAFLFSIFRPLIISQTLNSHLGWRRLCASTRRARCHSQSCHHQEIQIYSCPQRNETCAEVSRSNATTHIHQ